MRVFKMSPIVNLKCTTEFIFTILHVVYYQVDIYCITYSAVMFFSAVRFSTYSAVWIWPYVEVPVRLYPSVTNRLLNYRTGLLSLINGCN